MMKKYTHFFSYFQQSNSTTVYFERNFRTQHLQLQCIAVPNSKSDQVLSAFEAAFVKYGIESAVIRDTDTLIGDLVSHQK